MENFRGLLECLKLKIDPTFKQSQSRLKCDLSQDDGNVNFN